MEKYNCITRTNQFFLRLEAKIIGGCPEESVDHPSHVQKVFWEMCFPSLNGHASIGGTCSPTENK
ncbi:hypothetical protein BLOT_003978 [Blomia tropicalis]|nr:hypothetical protein BLOT_003978 [Blomia tropicalis]